MVTHSETELSQAVTSMFRVRAVESPPDPNGERTIWHRGAKGADLVTWIDTLGKVTRQELYLFEDCLVWEKGVGLRTGAQQEPLGTKPAPEPIAIAFDPEHDKARLKRARSGLNTYAGDDKCIVHARQLVNQATRGEPEDELPSASKTLTPASAITAVNPRPVWIWAVAVGAGALLVATGLWLLLSR
ncbi:MAG: hypothetical protein QM723_03860 [Myxococcaceae bacterium]